MARRCLSVILAVAAVLVALVAPASADLRRVDDRNDTHGPLDIEWVRQGHDYGKIRYGLATSGNWSERDLRDGRFIFSFDLDADPRFERFVVVHWRDWEETEGGKLASPVKNSKRKVVGRAGVAHWSGSKLRIWVARRHLEFPTRYRMKVSSEWREGECADSTCVDDAPLMSHRLWPLCDGYDPTIVGTTGDDRIEGEPGEVIYARGGDDRIEGIEGYWPACGGPGNDVLVGGTRPDSLFGGTGDDVLYGRRARIVCKDRSVGSGDCPLPTNFLYGGAGDDHVYGGPDVDHLYGGRGYDSLDGRDGDDSCHGGEVEQRC